MKKNRVSAMIARLLVPVLFGTLFSSQTVTALAAEKPAAEEYETIEISTAKELIELSQQCSMDVWSRNKRIVLQEDISLKNSDYAPIPTFGGIFDGNGHTVSGLELTQSVTPVGFISTVQEQGVVKNLKVSGTIAPEGEGTCAGGIAGENNGLITGCSFSGNVIGAGRVGGVAGVNALTGQIADCGSNGTIIGEKMTGGIAGCNLGSVIRCKNYAYINTVSTDPSISLEDIHFDFVFDVSRMTSVDTGRAASDTGGIAGYSRGILEECVNSAPVGYPHIGYNAGGIAGRSCGYIRSCENAADIYGRKDVGGIVGQMEPYIRQNVTESALEKLDFQLDELNVLLNRTLDTADFSVNIVTSRLNQVAGYLDDAAEAAQNIHTYGSVTSTVTLNRTLDTADFSVNIVTSRLNQVAGYLDDAAEAAQNIHTYGSVTSTVTGSGSADGNGSVTVKPSVSGNGLTEENGHSGSVNGNISASTQISITTQLNGLSSAILGMSGQMKLLNGEVSGISGNLREDLKAVQNQIHAISDTAMSLFTVDDEEDMLVDSSETDVERMTHGKALACENSGKVNGDINVGGIAGSMAMEYELDPEDDISSGLNGMQRRKLELRAVAESCVNTGEIIAKRSYAGGICGRMELGLITQAENYGDVISESGDYVGGIAGLTASTVRQCAAKCTLSGDKYVGGIVGSGVSEDLNGGTSTVAGCAIAGLTASTVRQCAAKCTLSGDKYVGGIVGSGVSEDLNGGTSTVAGCAAMVEIAACEEYDGAVSGVDAGDFTENYFVSDELAGINRRSYAGRAEPVVYEELFQSASAPDAFRRLTLTFVADGKELKKVPFAYGESFDGDIFPELPRKEGHYAEWDRSDLQNLHFDTIVEAVYTPYVSALANQEKRPDGRNIFLVEGQFDEAAQLVTAKVPGTPEAFGIIPKNWADFLAKSFTGTTVCREITEQWQLAIPEDGVKNHTIRYLPPEETDENFRICVKEGQVWNEVSTETIGSYLTFETAGNAVEIAVLSVVEVWWVWLIAALLLLLLLAAAVRLLYKRAGRKKRERLLAENAVKAATEESENAAEAAATAGPENAAEATATAGPEKEADAEPEAEKKERLRKKKRKWVICGIAAALLIAGTGGTVYFVLEKASAAAKAYESLKTYTEKKELSMDLSVEGKIGEKRFDFSVYAERTDVEGQRITVVSRENRNLYYAEGAVFLENGKAYRLSPAFPDYSKLSELALELYRHSELSEENGVYTIMARQEDAKAILEMLMPFAADALPDTNVITVKLITENGQASEICFAGRGTLKDEEKPPFDFSANMKLHDRRQKKIQIPKAVADAVSEGRYESTEVLSDALLQLADAWQALNEPDALGAKIVLEADCGPIVLNESFDFYHWKNEGAPVNSLQKNGYAVYFSDGAVCDSSGSVITDSDRDTVEAAKLLDIAYEICMNARLESSETAEGTIYSVILDENGMKEVAYAIVPEAKNLDIGFTGGSIQVIIRDGKLQNLLISCSGKLEVLLSEADVKIGAELQFTGEEVTATIPQNVKDMLEQSGVQNGKE